MRKSLVVSLKLIRWDVSSFRPQTPEKHEDGLWFLTELHTENSPLFYVGVDCKKKIAETLTCACTQKFIDMDYIKFKKPVFI